MTLNLYLKLKKRIIDNYKKDSKALRALFCYVEEIDVDREA